MLCEVPTEHEHIGTLPHKQWKQCNSGRDHTHTPATMHKEEKLPIFLQKNSYNLKMTATEKIR